MKKPRTVLLGLLFGLMLAPLAHPAPAPAALAEIEYLLGYMGSSGCEFYRNGTWYDPLKAQAHLRYKYDWLVTHDQIESAEDFIDKAATKSSLSGQAYKVRCGFSAERSSSEWFRELLSQHRARRSRAARGADSHLMVFEQEIDHEKD